MPRKVPMTRDEWLERIEHVRLRCKAFYKDRFEEAKKDAQNAREDARAMRRRNKELEQHIAFLRESNEQLAADMARLRKEVSCEQTA